MDNSNFLDSILFSADSQLSYIEFIVNLFIAGLLAFILGHVYQKFGNALSNRKSFSNNFILLTLVTVLVISIIKSSLALSLGLVGALSIVRFRGAIKEPEELAYLFFAIGIGVGIGANQVSLTVIAFFVIILFIISIKLIKRDKIGFQNLYLTISGEKNNEITSDKIIDCLSKYFTSINIKRLEEDGNSIEISFLVEFENIDKLEKVKTELFRISPKINFNFIDNKGIM